MTALTRALPLLGLAALLAAACGGGPAAPTATPEPLALTDQQLTPLLATTVLRTGTQRVAFVLEAPTALVSAPTALITTTHLDGAAEGETERASFNEWPFATRGAYAADLTFPEPGRWRLDIVIDEGPVQGTAELVLDVAETSVVADVGALPPFSNTKTLFSEGGDLSKLTSHFRPDPDLYESSVAETLFSGRPSVIVFASPAFCTSPTCGPQVDTLVELKELYAGEADFVHVEIYDNPHEIQGDLTRAAYTRAVREWGIDQTPEYRNESWTFVLGSDGRISARFQGYATLSELEAALAAAG